MPGRDFDDAELRPLSEATPFSITNSIPAIRTDAVTRRSHSSADDGPTRECRSCGASIPVERTKCRFCLSNHIEPLDVDDAADETACLHVIPSRSY